MFKSKITSILSAVLALVLTFALVPGAALAAEKEITVFVNGIHLEPDTPPIMEDGRTLVPLRAVFEAMGAEVEWDAYNRTAIVEKDGIVIKITIDQPYMTKNGETVPLDVPARIVNNRTLIPVRAVSEALEAKVDWDGENRWVLITISKNAPYSSLSPTDMAKFKDSYTLLRYVFEQYALSNFALNNSEICEECIRSRDAFLPAMVYSLWSSTAMMIAQDIQSESATDYQIPVGERDEDLIDAYMGMIVDAGFDPRLHFEAAYDYLRSGRSVLLVSFFNADEGLLPCLYLAIAMDNSGKARYFTAETDPTGKLFICEITEVGHGVWYYTDDMTKTTFLQIIDDVIMNNRQVQVSVVRE